ncbi:hypothetical protein D8674_021856 [Pyrus ussuriensis x Pyrus communis]|uniref:TMV resistance protein N-like n=1 Tax=Pyrus ussuriensis x Pyrus communis TaxID=2448454 RepID=A0A5N5GIS8_9ROSA|nr:hypothetical protein D8674_021856 [Pyrus ussuriensis x Pyrus communis]
MRCLLNGLHRPSLQAPNLEFPEGVAPARILAEGSPTNHSTFACLYFFRVCRTRVDLEWGASVLRSLEVMSKVARKPMAFNFECTSSFTFWWEHLFIKSYPKPSELESWEEMIHQKNQLPLIGTSYFFNLWMLGKMKRLGDAFVLQEAAAKAERQGAEAGRGISELLGDSEGPQVTKKPTVVSRKDPLGAEMYQKAKDLSSSIPSTSHPLVVASTSQFDSSTGEMLHFVEEYNNPMSTSSMNLSPSPMQEVITPYSKALGSILKKVKTAVTTSISAPALEILHSLPTEAVPSVTAKGVGEIPPPLSSTPSVTSLPKLVNKFGQIKTKLQSPSLSLESHLLQNASRIFEDWMKRDFTASFSLKILHDAKKAQYKSFLSFFEKLWALRDHHQKVEWVSNRVKCFQEKHTKTSATLQ